MLSIAKNTIMFSVIMLTPSVIVLRLSVIMLCVIMMNVIMLSVVIPSVVAPSQAIAIKILGSIYHSKPFNHSLMFYEMLVQTLIM